MKTYEDDTHIYRQWTGPSGFPCRSVTNKAVSKAKDALWTKKIKEAMEARKLCTF